MTHAAKFWADKVPESLRWHFWELVSVGFGGETAYHRTMAGTYLPKVQP